MIEAPIPQDILKYKTKFIGNFSMREMACLAAGVVAIIYPYMTFIKDWELEITYKIVIAALFGLPFFALGFVQLLGQPLEKVLIPMFMENFIYPMTRKKETHHPEFEKFVKTKEWEKDTDEETEDKEKNKITDLETTEENIDLNKKKNSTTKKQNNKKKKVKIERSTEFVGIK